MEVSPWSRHSDAASDRKPTHGHIADAEELRETYRAPTERSLKKQMSRFDKHSREFFARSPFLVMDRSVGPVRRLAKGRRAGLRPGDRRHYFADPRPARQQSGRHARKLVARRGIGLIFFVPGINETLRVIGQWCVTTDHALFEPLAVNGKVLRSGILVSAEEIYFDCGKALIRSDLWNSEKHLRRSAFPSLATVLTEQIGGAVVGDPGRLESYKTRLY
jgi:predicted pyridoxine 5'-phosphate oxidase superfamily flavin-nucleotide-binding protein